VNKYEYKQGGRVERISKGHIMMFIGDHTDERGTIKVATADFHPFSDGYATAEWPSDDCRPVDLERDNQLYVEGMCDANDAHATELAAKDREISDLNIPAASHRMLIVAQRVIIKHQEGEIANLRKLCGEVLKAGKCFATCEAQECELRQLCYRLSKVAEGEE